MRSRILTKSRHVIDCITEKIMEWIETIRNLAGKQRDEYSNLTEVYTIKGDVSESSYIQNFLKERFRIIRQNRYRMSVRIDNFYNESMPGEIGKVTLYCKERYVDEAILVTKAEENSENRLIYWKFKKK